MNRKKSHGLSFLAGALTLAIITINQGCQAINTQNDPAFVNAADRFVNQTVGPEYEVYVMQDPALGTPGETNPIREDRLQNVRTFRDAVAQAKLENSQNPVP